MDTSDERLPGFDAVDSQFSFDPPCDHRLKEFLKVSAALRRAVGGSHSNIEFADVGIRVDKVRETFFKHDVTLKFVEFRKHDGLGETQAVVSISFADSSFGVAMTDAWAGGYSVEGNSMASPILTQYTRLRLAGGRELVVIGLKKRS